MRAPRETTQPLRASPAFALAVLVTLGLAGLIGLMVFLMQVRPGFLGMAHGTEPHHRIHDLTYGFLFATAVVGLLAQLRRPSQNVAGQLMTLIPWVGLLLAAVLSTDAGVILSAERLVVAAGTVIAALLHPARRDFVRSFSVSQVNWVMLALVVVAAVPPLAFASTNLELQRTVPDDHAAMGHYGFMAAFGFAVVGVSLLASLRPVGWRLTAWVAGLLPTLLGLASLVYRDATSSLGPVWALTAIAWGVGFVAAAELTHTRDRERIWPTRPPTPATTPAWGLDRGSTTSTPPGTPRWVYVSGIVVIVLILLLVIMHLTGGGLGGHTP